jgi:hypothetical protein
MTEIQERIINQLHKGSNHPITAKVLAPLVGLPSQAQSVPVRNEIKNLRLEGHLIGSNNKGYFKIIDEEDYKVTINHLSSRIKETQTIIACLQENFQNRENG